MAEDSLRARKRRQTRQSILSACERLFRSRGYEATTIDLIVGEAAVSRKTFFNHFATKDVALAELGLQWLRTQGQAARLGARTGNPQSLLDGLRRYQRAQLAAIERDREFMTLVFARSGAFFPQGSRVGSSSDVPRLDVTRAFFRDLTELLQAAQNAGQIRPDASVDQIAEIYVGTMVTVIRLWLTRYWGDRGSLVDRGMRAFDLLENGFTAGTRI